MSFIAEAATRRMATISRTAFPSVANSAPRAAFSSSVTLQKSAVDSAKDTLKTVDRAVSDKLVDGINVGTTVASKLKEVSEDALGTKNTGAAAEFRGQASGKASELSGQAQGKANQLGGQAQGKASELAGKAQGLASEAEGKIKGAAEEAKEKLT